MTQVVHVPLGDRAYDIHISRGLLDQAGSLIGPILQRTKVAIVTDSNVAPLHLRRFTEALQGAGIAHASPASSESAIDILDWMDARAISELIIDEHPQIKALIISYLDFGLGADVLTLLPDEIQADIVRRIATIETVEPGAVKELERVMKEKFAANTSLRASKIGGVKAAAKIMNFTKTEMETRILTSIKKEDKDLMAEIQDNMFVFENLSSSDDRSLQTLLRSVDQDVLIIAMKGAETALQDKLLGCMSTRAAANIRDEMEALGPVRLTEVQEAQKQIINVARKLSDDGTIVLAGRGGEEMV